MTNQCSEIAPGLWMEEYEPGRFMVTGKSGTADVIIHRNGSPKSPRLETPPFTVRASGNIGQEILDLDGNVFAWTTDPVKAALIVKLLTLHKKVEDKKASSGL